MIRRWEKLGQLYVPGPAGRHPKLVSHAANPLAVHLEGDLFRVFYSGRDEQNRSSVGAVDIDIVRRRIIREHETPIFEHGPAGSYYVDGVSIGNCYTVDGVRYMLFMGWQSPGEGHWRGDIGRLIVNPDLTLRLDGEAPLLASDDVDPLSLSYPWVLEGEDGIYRMWYGSTRTWDAGNGEMLHVIHWATSTDGRCWQREGLAVPYSPGIAQAFSRPAVVRAARGGLEMWFSCRGGSGEKYRIGYAVCGADHKWQLALDAAGIEPSPEGWDSEMIEYPFVFDHADRRYMLYNGNGYGRTGFGLAVLEQD